MKIRRLFYLISSLLALVIWGCSPAPDPIDAAEAPSDEKAPTATTFSPTETTMPSIPTPAMLELTSAAFEDGQAIPVRYACHGENISPPLTWTNSPEGTKSFVLVMDDPDAVNVVGFVWDHWLLFNLSVDNLSLKEAISQDGEFPSGSLEGMNSGSRLGYGGPCPPSGETHDYVFTMYAIDAIIELEQGVSKEDILQAIEGHVLAKGQLVGRYTSP